MELPPNIRRALPDDLGAMVTLENICFPSHCAYSKQQLRYLSTQANGRCFVNEKDDHLRGFIIVLFRKGSCAAMIETLDVDPRCRGTGVGLSLLQAAEQEVRRRGVTKIMLEVSALNYPARRLYEKFGFVTTRYIRDYYLYAHQGTRDAIKMIKILT